MYNQKFVDDYQDKAASWWSKYDETTSKHTRGAKNCTLQVTETCNLACTYCYQVCKSSKSMSFDIARKYIDTILEDKEINEKYEAIILDFIGGEPLIEVELIDKVVDYFKYRCIELEHKFGYRYKISICSNGTLYFNKRVQEFFKKHKRDISFSISIDGNKELHDACRIFHDGTPSYDLAVRAALHYRDNYAGVLPGTKMTLAPENIMYTYDALVNLIKIGYTDIFANCVYEAEWTTEHASHWYYGLKKLSDYVIDNDLEEEVYLTMFDADMFRPYSDKDEDNNWCGGNGEMLAVDPDGIIYPCLRYMKSSLGDSQPPITCGTIDSGVDHEVLDCMQCITRTSQSTKECNDCPIAVGCAWCTAYNYQVTGSINKRVTSICIMHKARALANVYFWNKIYRKHNMIDRFTNHLPDKDSLSIIDKDELLLLKSMEE